VYLLEGFYVVPTPKSAKSHFEKIRTKMDNSPVGKKVNTPKGYLFFT